VLDTTAWTLSDRSVNIDRPFNLSPPHFSNENPDQPEAACDDGHDAVKNK
jgi:hypothetical protein